MTSFPSLPVADSATGRCPRSGRRGHERPHRGSRPLRRRKTPTPLHRGFRDGEGAIREAPMLVTRQKILRRFWYPVVPSDRLVEAPLPFTLLGTNIVLFRD